MKILPVLLSALLLWSSLLGAQEDPRTKPVVVPIPDASQYRVTRDIEYLKTDDSRTLADVFVPAQANEKRPVLVFLHGGGGSKDLGQFQSLGALAADAGLAAMAFSYRFGGVDSFQLAAADAQAAVEYIRQNANDYSIDKDRVCLWLVSSGGVVLAPLLAEQPAWLKCVVIHYGAMGPESYRAMGAEVSKTQAQGLDPLPLLEADTRWKPALFIAEAGADHAGLNTVLRQFAETAANNAWPLAYWNHPTGPHGFDVLTEDARSRQIIRRSVAFVKAHLAGNDNQ